MIELTDISKIFNMGKTNEYVALSGINLAIQLNKITVFRGPSGSGKTTLLNIIGSLDDPSEGRAEVLGKSVSELTHKESAKLRNLHIGFIFQTYNLLSVYTVFENVEFALLLQDMSAAERKKAVMESLAILPSSAKIMSLPPPP